MTNSTTSSSAENENVQISLEKFLGGKLSASELQETLQGRVSLNFDKAPSYRSLQDISLDDITPLSVTSSNLNVMLSRFCLGDLKGNELSNWAALLIALPVFVPEGETEEQQWAVSNGPVWDILHRIATPNVFSELTIDIVTSYIKRLETE
jgi:hypothetical protein